MIDKIKCTNCGEEIEISEAIYLQIKEEAELQVKSKTLKEFEEKHGHKIKELEGELEEKDKKLKEARDEELKLRKEKRELEEAKQNFELTVQRRVDENSKKIVNDALGKYEEERKFKDAEKDKVISTLRKDLEEANRRAQVGSQQLQGEVLEENTENLLRQLFPQDLIEEIAKGVNGSDIRQIVRSPRGLVCGVILWECKRTKTWGSDWVRKLKQDLRDEKADIPIIVSTTLPSNVKNGSGFTEGVYICGFAYVEFLAQVLRKQILAVAYQKAVSSNKDEKSVMLYEYVTGNDFRQKVEVLLEVYNSLREQTDKERKVYTKIWSERDMQLSRLLQSTVDVYGSMAGILGPAMPQIKDLDLPALESGEKADEE